MSSFIHSANTKRVLCVGLLSRTGNTAGKSLCSGCSGEGQDGQRTLVKKRMVLWVKVTRVEKEILVHKGDVVEVGWGCASDNPGGLHRGDIIRIVACWAVGERGR